MGPVVHKVKRLLVGAAIGVTIGAILTPILATEGALHIVERPRPERSEANGVAWSASSAWEPAQVTTPDGVTLDAWTFTPRHANGSAVILLHGIGDTRSGMLGHAGYLLRAGYTLLMPDSRGHGSSGGSVVTYGIREAEDVHSWVDWLFRERRIQRLYGLGQSMGAAVLLQSLPREPRFRAVVADCPFDTFEDIAYYRLEHASSLGKWTAWPVVQTGFLYARLVYGVDLKQASPAAAIRFTEVPILLIHGTRDGKIPASQSEALHTLNPQATSLWLVEGASHVSSLGANRREYARRVLEWWTTHP